MKGPTHNLTVRTRTDVALYVLNHKRGHLRDLESNFKVALAVIADPTISGQQSFVIDRGEAVHTLEAAKAILAAQVAAFPAAVEDTYEYEEDETLEAEAEAEFEGDDEETAETQSADAAPVAEGEEGPRRKRRRRRRGRGEAREGAVPSSDQNAVSELAPQADAAGDDGDEGDDEQDDQNGEGRADQTANGERRPRRRGRRGGRRRRGGNELGGTEDGQPGEGIVSTIADDLEPPAESESAQAVADLAAPAEPERQELPTYIAQPEPVSHHISTPEDTTPDEAPRKRSTVREKVSFFFGDTAKQEPQPAAQTPDSSSAPPPNAIA